ncbi:MAG: hypothetical protein U0L97_04455 [Candidatus Saccharimonadaceae bacterium]|nr:hypothetical protein [Candidatus Saccharimonadaceae bacterium]
MKKILLGLATILMVAVLAPLKAFAVGGFSVSTQNITLHPGESASFSITASNSAGKINLSSSNTNIASVDTDTVFLDVNSEDITVKANNIGTVSIIVTASSNFATYDEEILEGQSYEIAVNVIDKDPETNSNTQNNDTTVNQNETKNTNSTINTPDTGNNQQTNDSPNPIILSGIIGTPFTILFFTIFYLYNRNKSTK